MSGALLAALLIGTIAMLIPILIQAKWHKIRFWKSAVLAVVLTITGTLGTKIWFAIENGRFGGQSFFGAVFVVPVVFWAFAKVLKLSFGRLLDLCAPAECVMLIIMKFACLLDNCCGGKDLFTTAKGVVIVFPSQVVEMINALILAVLLTVMAKREKNRGTIYAWYMVLYGGTRFVLDFFRANHSPVLLGLSYGCFWALCSLIIGGVILVHYYYLKKKK